MEAIVTTIDTIFLLVQVVIGYNLVFPFTVYLMYRLNGVKMADEPAKRPAERDYAIIITAYEQVHTVPAAVDSVLKLNYSNYIVYVVADKCDISALQFNDKRVVVLRPPETLASNTRSHFYAIRNFVRQHDVLTIVDSDNLVDPNYLNELNKYFEQGYMAVQGQRKAKNLDTTYACLDAARDMYYHFYDGKLLHAVGSSATLAGSGMAFTVSLYRECLEHLDVTGAGFDKVLQYEILKRGYRIAFNEDAVVYDEKTSNSEMLVKQRARWINTWFKYARFGFSLVYDGILGLNWNKFLFGLVLLRPPLFLFLLFSMVFAATDMFWDMDFTEIWLAGMVLFIAGFIIAIAHSRPDKRITTSLWSIPRFMYYQVWSLLLARKANKISVATQHYNTTTINEVED